VSAVPPTTTAVSSTNTESGRPCSAGRTLTSTSSDESSDRYTACCARAATRSIATSGGVAHSARAKLSGTSRVTARMPDHTAILSAPMRALVGLSLALTVGCGGKPAVVTPTPAPESAEPSTQTPEPAALPTPPEPTAETMGADTPKATVAGNTFVAPAG